MAKSRARSGKGKAPFDVREFRHAVSVLKKQGVVSKRVDARKQAPTRYMRSKVRKFADVVEGKQVAVKAPRQMRDEYLMAGFEVRGSSIIVPKVPNTRASVRSGRLLRERKLKGGGSIDEIILPFHPKDITGLENAARRYKGEQPESDWSFAFRFYGKNSLQTFSDIDLMIEWLSHYQDLIEENEGAWEHFVLLRVRTGSWRPSPKPRSKQNRRGRYRYISDHARDKYNAKRAKIMQNKRSEMSTTERALENYKNAERQRARRAAEREVHDRGTPTLSRRKK